MRRGSGWNESPRDALSATLPFLFLTHPRLLIPSSELIGGSINSNEQNVHHSMHQRLNAPAR